MKIEKEIKKFKEENSEKKYIKGLMIKPLIYSSIFILLAIVSLVFSKKVVNFSKMISSSNFISILIVILYYLALVGNIAMLLTLGIYTMKLKSFNSLWYEYSIKFQKKIDVPSFILDCVIIFCFIATFFFTPCTVSGDSMNNTYIDKDRLICSACYIELNYDDVIVFNSKNYTSSDESMYIKRVVAKENDLLYYNKDENTLYSNGIAISSDLSLSMYKNIYESLGYEDYIDSFIVPKDKLLVFGDNRPISYDSRYFGFIDKKDVVGKVIFRLYPFKSVEKIIIE